MRLTIDILKSFNFGRESNKPTLKYLNYYGDSIEPTIKLVEMDTDKYAIQLPDNRLLNIDFRLNAENKNLTILYNEYKRTQRI
tara:strand:- start:4580 stop:4828 length:249 start_codon:yes stop_codon:yes gene_type:complete